MLKQGDQIMDRSSFTLVQEGEDGRALFADQWNIYYTTDRDGQLQYVGHNLIDAEVELHIPQFALEADP